MKSQFDLILAQVGEESTEVAQQVFKVQRFGLNDFCEKYGATNKRLLQGEILDLLTLVEMSGVMEDMSEEDKLAHKARRVGKTLHYLKVSAELGQYTPHSSDMYKLPGVHSTAR